MYSSIPHVAIVAPVISICVLISFELIIISMFHYCCAYIFINILILAETVRRTNGLSCISFIFVLEFCFKYCINLR